MPTPKSNDDNPFVSRHFFLFLCTGGSAAAVNIGSRYLYNLWVPYSAAIVLAYLSGMVTAYLLARRFVFKETRHSTVRSALYFTLVSAVTALQTWAVSVGLAYHVFPALGLHWHDRDIAHLIGVAVPVFSSYLGHRRWSFRA